jgi:hypothetical protein
VESDLLLLPSKVSTGTAGPGSPFSFAATATAAEVAAAEVAAAEVAAAEAVEASVADAVSVAVASLLLSLPAVLAAAAV